MGNIGDNVNYCMFAYNNMKKQLELDLKEAMNDKPLGETSNCISHQEIARVLHADHSEYKMGTLVYGTYEEIEYWCEQNDMFVDKYLDHVNPSTLYNTAEWVGTGVSDPFSVSVPFDYRENRAMGTFNTRGVNLEKW